MVFELDKVDSVAHNFLIELRTGYQHADRMRFRKNMQRLGSIMAYEISKSLPYIDTDVATPLGYKKSRQLNIEVVLGTILRAGLPFYQGFLDFFDQAENAFVGAYRTEERGSAVAVEMEYSVSAPLDEKALIIIDPMLATGKSLVTATKSLLEQGKPAVIHVAAILAAPEGVDYIRKNLPMESKIWVCSLDSHLNDDFFIVPGLGDAGDMAFGSKK
jgi:uracil phosphoribosyltransferase